MATLIVLSKLRLGKSDVILEIGRNKALIPQPKVTKLMRQNINHIYDKKFMKEHFVDGKKYVVWHQSRKAYLPIHFEKNCGAEHAIPLIN